MERERKRRGARALAAADLIATWRADRISIWRVAIAADASLRRMKIAKLYTQ